MTINTDDENEDAFALVDWDKVKAIELWKACIHECAHAAIARRFGASAEVKIRANADTSMQENLYIGRCKIVPELPKEQTRLVALAGVIAEQFGKNHDVTGDFIAKWIELENITLSARDAAGASGDTRRDLDECVSLVRQLWTDIEREASHLNLIAVEMRIANPKLCGVL